MLVFFTLAVIFLPRPGIQNDEALFSSVLYLPVPKELKIRAFHHDVPLMLMTYLGAAKSWLYALIFRLWKPDVFSLRLPMAIAGTVSIGLLWLAVRRFANRRTALAACMLIATDAAYLLTTVFDWGPVALQHLAWLGGVLLVSRRSPRGIFWGFLLFGFGMWDKALFSWVLSGTAVAAVAVFPREVWQSVRPRTLALATAGFVLGAWPLIVYNVRNPFQTFSGNTVFSTSSMATKLEVAEGTLTGRALFGYLTEGRPPRTPVAAANALEAASLSLSRRLGGVEDSFTDYALWAALALAPVWWRRGRLAAFALITMAVAWAQMLFNQGTGGSAHHVVLLWPLPQIVIAVALIESARRLGRTGNAATAAVLAVLCAANLAVVNEYLARFIERGPSVIWTDALAPLKTALEPFESHHIVVTGWGADNGLRLLQRGRAKTLWTIGELLDHAPTAQDREGIAHALALPAAVFVSYTRGNEIQPGVADRLQEAARALGYHRQIIETARDRHGREIFELARFVR